MVRMQPESRVMVPSQELPIQINQQVQPVDGGSRKQPGFGPDQHMQPDSSRPHLHGLKIARKKDGLQERQCWEKVCRTMGVVCGSVQGCSPEKREQKVQKVFPSEPHQEALNGWLCPEAAWTQK